MRALFAFRTLYVAHTRPFAATLLLSFLTLAAGVALLGVSGWFLTGAAITTASLSFNLVTPSALVRGLSLVRILSRYGEKLVGHKATIMLLADLREWIYRRLIPRMPLDVSVWRHGDLVSRLTADIEALNIVFIAAIGPAAAVLLLGMTFDAVLAVWLPTGACVFAIGLVVGTIVVPSMLAAAVREKGRAQIVDASDLRIATLDGIEGHSDLRLFDAIDAAQSSFIDRARRVAATGRGLGLRTALAACSVQMIAGFTALGVLWCGLSALRAGTIGGPTLVGLVLATLAAFEAANVLVRSAGKFGTAAAAADRLRDLANAEAAISDPPQAIPLQSGACLRLDNVTFSRRSHGPPLLRDVNLFVEAGSRVAITGESGSGKSSLLDLLVRLADVGSGTVRVAGTDIRRVTQADLHRRVALMSQTTPVFLGTIRDNLLIGSADADVGAIWAALQATQLETFVAGLSDGLETWLGEGGRTLSVGEARRLCLARVLLSPAAILLMDEPTHGLDAEAERAFLIDIAQATSGRTVILATHAQLPNGIFDHVLRLEQGTLRPVDPMLDLGA